MFLKNREKKYQNHLLKCQYYIHLVQTTSKKIIIRINYNLISHLAARTEVFICILRVEFRNVSTSECLQKLTMK